MRDGLEPDGRPELLVLRALKLGDLLVAVPAMLHRMLEAARAGRRAGPHHRHPGRPRRGRVRPARERRVAGVRRGPAVLRLPHHRRGQPRPLRHPQRRRPGVLLRHRPRSGHWSRPVTVVAFRHVTRREHRRFSTRAGGDLGQATPCAPQHHHWTGRKILRTHRLATRLVAVASAAATVLAGTVVLTAAPSQAAVVKTNYGFQTSAYGTRVTSETVALILLSSPIDPSLCRYGHLLRDRGDQTGEVGIRPVLQP